MAADWQSIQQSPEFRELVERRKRFVLPVTAVWLSIFMAYLLLASLAPDIMGNEFVFGFTLGFALSAAQVLMTWVVVFLYMRQANRVFAPLEQRAARVAAERARGGVDVT